MADELEQALQKAVSQLPECMAAGYVDLDTGMLMGIRTVDSHPNEVLDLLAAATAEMFQGQTVTTIEKMFKKSRGVEDDGKHYFHEMIVTSENLIPIFLRSKPNPQPVAGFVCRASANLGMAMQKARAAMPSLEEVAA